MPGLTPDEQERVNKVQLAMGDPTQGSGDSFGLPLMLTLFLRIVKLRDFAEQQHMLNIQLAARVRELEIRMGTHSEDISEVYLRMTSFGDEYVE